EEARAARRGESPPCTSRRSLRRPRERGAGAYAEESQLDGDTVLKPLGRPEHGDLLRLNADGL
ncbi:MAG: hypothetical protein GWO02_20480, partial [Gammaproteobacteria bacterium]|nr:hypothetical protein [Gammaproteobacteria bacterium]